MRGIAAVGAGRCHFLRAAAALLALALPISLAAAQNVDAPRIETNQAYIEDLQRTAGLDINDPLTVFAVVFASLPLNVKVYPTENYYYFSFAYDGKAFHGNLRLDPTTRDDGRIEFGYFQGLSQWNEAGGIERFVVLDASHGVRVERLERLAYRVSYKDKSVVFTLNDLSGVRPPPEVIGSDEQFLGPVFDEFGVRFFLVFNKRLKAFHFILDETAGVTDELHATKQTDRIVIGRRTGFAFYRDHRLNRRILIGAFEGNTNANTWFDGPFDQLPENFIEGEELRDAIVAADPSVKGKIGRLGHYLNEEGRYLINPYMIYGRESDLLRIHRCATGRQKRSDYYRCFVVSNDGEVDPPVPAAPAKKK